MDGLRPDSLIPPELAIKGIDDILYETGLFLTSVKERPALRIMDNPWKILVINLIYLCQRTACILVADKQSLTLLGEVGRYYGARVHTCLLQILICLMGLSCQLIVFFNHR